ncbi:MAG: nuclear transport factor 2 family protein [Betaproteobacteria bacterium]
MAADVPERVQTLVRFFEQLQRSDLPQLAQLYAAQAYFKDPFNEVRGWAQIERIFEHMYEALDQPHFVVTDQILQGRQCFLVWEFRFRFKRFDRSRWQTVRGSSHLRFDEQGLVEFHRDYWDAAEELYEKIPGIAALMRWLRRQANR